MSVSFFKIIAWSLRTASVLGGLVAGSFVQLCWWKRLMMLFAILFYGIKGSLKFHELPRTIFGMDCTGTPVRPQKSFPFTERTEIRLAIGVLMFLLSSLMGILNGSRPKDLSANKSR
jgi:hypothetical protein